MVMPFARQVRATAYLVAAVIAAGPALSQDDAKLTLVDVLNDVYALRQINALKLTKPQAQQLLQVLKAYHEGDMLAEFVKPETVSTLRQVRADLLQGKGTADDQSIGNALVDVTTARQRLLRGEDGVGMKIAKILSRDQMESMRGRLPTGKESAPKRLAAWTEKTIRTLSEDRWKTEKDAVMRNLTVSYIARPDSPEFAEALAKTTQFFEHARKMSDDEFNLYRLKLPDEIAKLLGWDTKKNCPGAGRPIDPAVLDVVVRDMLRERFMELLEERMKTM